MGIVPDFILPSGLLPPRTGRVCYQIPDLLGGTSVVDCLAYGGVPGGNRRLRPAPPPRPPPPPPPAGPAPGTETARPARGVSPPPAPQPHPRHTPPPLAAP